MKRTLSKTVLIAVLTGVFLPAGRLPAGNLDAPAEPANALSAMWTLNDIYNVLDTRTTNVAKRTTGFAEPAGGPTVGTMHTLDEIMTLVTNRAPVAKTGQTTSYQPEGDDGAYKVGVAWPNPRFTVGDGVDGTNCVTDNLTGLMWARNVNIDAANGNGSKVWLDAIAFCENLVYGGHSDWRLPNIRELQSLTDLGRSAPAICNTAGTGPWEENDPFTGISLVSGGYWSSTVYAGDTENNAWFWDLVSGNSGSDLRDSDRGGSYFVWPVRGGR